MREGGRVVGWVESWFLVLFCFHLYGFDLHFFLLELLL